MAEETLKLGKNVLVARYASYNTQNKKTNFLINWLSDWHNIVIELGIKAIRKDADSWEITEIMLPAGIKKEDAEDILNSHWRIINKHSNEECPQLYFVWEYTAPPVYVVACERPTRTNQKPFKEQLKGMIKDPEVDLGEWSIINTLRQLGPAICTVVSPAGILEFDITESGKFASRSFCPDYGGAPGEEMDEAMLDHLMFSLSLGGSGVTVRTFTPETVGMKGESGNIVSVPIKELRSFIVTPGSIDNSNEHYLSWYQLPANEVKHMYSLDSETGEYIGLTVSERDHRFV